MVLIFSAKRRPLVVARERRKIGTPTDPVYGHRPHLISPLSGESILPDSLLEKVRNRQTRQHSRASRHFGLATMEAGSRHS